VNLSTLFLNRPIATTLLTIAVVLAGVLAFLNLPVAALPQVDMPTISVSTTLPGASPETMAATVATPLERALGRIAGVNEMTSTSAQGSAQITLQFDLSRDIDGASRDVQAAINAAMSLLPTSLPSRPSFRRMNPSDMPIVIMTLTSDIMSRGKMYDLASTVLMQKLSQVQGVGQVMVGGGALPAVRVELNPYALSHYGISLDDVSSAITHSNVNRPKGSLEQADKRWQILANDQGKVAADYLPLIIAYRQGRAVTMADVAAVEDSVEDVRNAGVADGKRAILIIIRKQAEANVIETVDAIKALLPQLRADLPDNVHLQIMQDRSESIRKSIDEVEMTLLLSIGLVMLVVWVFLRDFHASMVPIVSIPAALLGACSVMYLCGYSINNLSLMALTIATGFVVDDAIVVLENASRHVENGLSPLQAARKASQEVGFTVLSMSLSLVAVFLPILLMGGVVGRMFREFAVTLSAAVLVSLVISLTTTPVMCARWLKPQRSEAVHEHWYDGLGRMFERLQRQYQHSLHWCLARAPWVMLVLAAVIALNVYLFVIIDKGFFPTQDTGRIGGTVQVDQDASFMVLRQKLLEYADLVQQDPAVEHVVGFLNNQRSSGTGELFITLKPMDKRPSLAVIQNRLRKQSEQVVGARLLLNPQQELRIGGRISASMFDFTLQSDDWNELKQWTPKAVQALSALDQLKDVNTDQQNLGDQVRLVVDRERALRLGITQSMIDATLNNAFGQRQVSVIYNPLNQYHVVMELAQQYWQNPKTLEQIYIDVPVANNANGDPQAGKQVPLSSIARFEDGNTALSVNHQGQFAASTISFNLKPGVSLSEATQVIKKALREAGLPHTITGGFQGSAKAFQESSKNQGWLIVTALLSIYIVLGILYESYIHPLTILSTLPSAGVGALLALMLCDTDLSVIAFIGVILLIGIVKKNAIMMIDFALHAERNEGLSPQEAIFQACVLRFRPIMMTTLAALFGALPLAFASGFGAELRQPLGISIVGGLLLSQLLTLYTTPVVYLYLDRLRLWCLQRWGASEQAEHGAGVEHGQQQINRGADA
jgi:multidrug efflux pump